MKRINFRTPEFIKFEQIVLESLKSNNLTLNDVIFYSHNNTKYVIMLQPTEQLIPSSYGSISDAKFATYKLFPNSKIITIFDRYNNIILKSFTDDSYHRTFHVGDVIGFNQFCHYFMSLERAYYDTYYHNMTKMDPTGYSGYHFEWHHDGTISAISKYKYGVRIKSTSYTTKGYKFLLLTYDENEKEHGTIKTWSEHCEGKLIRTTQYKHGQRHGKDIIWNEARIATGRLEPEKYFVDKILEINNYKNGKLHGIQKKWACTSRDTSLGSVLMVAYLETIKHYKDGKLHGKSIDYDHNGNKMFKYTYLDGEMHGWQYNYRDKIQEYFKNGDLIKYHNMEECCCC